MNQHIIDHDDNDYEYIQSDKIQSRKFTITLKTINKNIQHVETKSISPKIADSNECNVFKIVMHHVYPFYNHRTNIYF